MAQPARSARIAESGAMGVGPADYPRVAGLNITSGVLFSLVPARSGVRSVVIAFALVIGVLAAWLATGSLVWCGAFFGAVGGLLGATAVSWWRKYHPTVTAEQSWLRTRRYLR